MTPRNAHIVSRFFRLLGATSILLGCLLLSLPFIPLTIPLQPTAAKTQVVGSATTELSGYPTRIIIPRLELSVPLFALPYTDERWAVPTGGAAVLTNPEAVGALGQVIYGHNWKSIFGNLNQAKVGDVLATEQSTGQRQLYTVTEVFTTDAKDRSALARGNEKSLLVYTCSGWLDSQRVVVVAEQL